MRSVAELAVEAVGVKQRQEELEVFLLAVVRRGRHQEEMAGFAAQPLAQAEAGGLRELRARIVGGEFVGLVEDDQVPAGGEEFFLERAGPLFLAIAAEFASGELVEADNEFVGVLEGVGAGSGIVDRPREDAELQAELLEEFVPPLLNKTAGGHDEHPRGVGPHDEFADVEARHDRLAGARVVGEDVPQRLPGQERLVDGRDLMGQRVYVRRVDCHHGVEQEGQVDPLRLTGELEGVGIAVEGPGPLGGGGGDAGCIVGR